MSNFRIVYFRTERVPFYSLWRLASRASTSSSNVASLLEKALQGCFGPAEVPSFSGNLRSDTPASKRDPQSGIQDQQICRVYTLMKKTMPYFV